MCPSAQKRKKKKKIEKSFLYPLSSNRGLCKKKKNRPFRSPKSSLLTHFDSFATDRSYNDRRDDPHAMLRGDSLARILFQRRLVFGFITLPAAARAIFFYFHRQRRRVQSLLTVLDAGYTFIVKRGLVVQDTNCSTPYIRAYTFHPRKKIKES